MEEPVDIDTRDYCDRESPYTMANLAVRDIVITLLKGRVPQCFFLLKKKVFHPEQEGRVEVVYMRL